MTDCIVVGGGVIGLLTARSLHRAGLDVVVIERGPLGGESSWAGGGIISPLYPWRYSDAVNRLAERSKILYPALVEELEFESGVNCELVDSGMLYTEVDEYSVACRWAEQWQQNIELITDQKTLRGIEPELHSDIKGGLWMPEIRQIRNPKLVRALRASLQALGLRYVEHAEVQEILNAKGKVTGVRTTGQELHADKVIVASGAWSARVMQGLAEINVEPVKGQMLMFHGEPGQIHRMVLSRGHYVIPRQDGRVLAGSTLENTGFKKEITSEAAENLAADAADLVPLLARLPIERQWAGLRPGTVNGIPYICAHPEIEGLYVHAGHYRNGIVLAPASTQLLTEMVLGEKPFCDTDDYSMGAAH